MLMSGLANESTKYQTNIQKLNANASKNSSTGDYFDEAILAVYSTRPLKKFPCSGHNLCFIVNILERL